jgi:hypothetical protein
VSAAFVSPQKLLLRYLRYPLDNLGQLSILLLGLFEEGSVGKSGEEVIPIVHAKLRARYGECRFLSGQGIAKGQRVEFDDNGKQVRCVIKTSSGGRISFAHRPDGTWSGLSECDRVVVVAPTSFEGDNIAVSMFDQQVLRDAFEANLAAQKTAGMDNVPCWIAPFHEMDRGVRGTGDGFGDKALWTEPMSETQPSATKPDNSPRAGPVHGLTLAEAKEGLARTFGVRPDQIEITIRG